MENQVKAEIIRKSELPEEAKTIGIMGALMGVSNDSIVHAMGTTINHIETAKAETANPQPLQPLDYTETEAKIAEMLQESTGTNFLDSGGAYGRSWQRNRMITDFRKKTNPTVEIHAPHTYTYEGKRQKREAEIIVNYDVFHYLTSMLELTETSKRLQKRFEEFAEQPENRNEGWLSIMEDFLEKLHKEYDEEYYGTTNTYNYDNILSQVLQYGMIEYKGDTYILLQIHNGCDVRGGYTKPQFFYVPDNDQFIIAQNDLNVSCKCGYCNASSDDGGYHWYPNETNVKTPLPKRLKFKRNPDRKAYGKDKAICKKCSEELEFSVNETWRL